MKNGEYKKELRRYAYQRARILALRSRGKSYQEIGDAIGITRQRAQQVVAAELARRK